MHNGYYNLQKLEIENSYGKIFERELFVNKDGVCTLLYNTTTQKYIFVKQWRPANNDYVIECVGGSIESGETDYTAITKEVFEETGYNIIPPIKIMEFYVSPGAITEKVSLFYTETTNKVKETLGVDDEEIELIEMDISEIKNYTFIDAKTIIAINNINEYKSNRI